MHVLNCAYIASTSWVFRSSVIPASSWMAVGSLTSVHSRGAPTVKIGCVWVRCGVALLLCANSVGVTRRQRARCRAGGVGVFALFRQSSSCDSDSRKRFSCRHTHLSCSRPPQATPAGSQRLLRRSAGVPRLGAMLETACARSCRWCQFCSKCIAAGVLLPLSC